MTAIVLALLVQASKVDQAKVDEAIREGVKFLKTANMGPWVYHDRQIYFHELTLLTLAHAGDDIIGPDDEFFQKCLKEVLDRELHWNYMVCLQAMALERIDKIKYQARLKQCAQHLVDNQCKNGQWGYGEKGVDEPINKTEGAAKPPKAGTRSIPRIPIARRKPGPPTGDNSNSQYAALGLRACHEGGIVFPQETTQLAAQWWEKSQHDDGGWGYQDKDVDLSRGSMTTGAIGSMCIYQYLRGSTDFKSAPPIQRGVKWLADHFSVTENPLMGQSKEYQNAGAHFFYYLYALERTGLLYGTEEFGKHEWYVEGAEYLLKKQNKDGSWSGVGHWSEQAVWDTCFAILFLRRATVPLKKIATEPSGQKK